MTTDQATLLTAIAALLVAIAAAYFAYQQWQAGRANARASEGSRQAADRAADAACESAEAAQRVARADLERDHRTNIPAPNGNFLFEKDRGGLGRWLVYEFQLSHEYDMTAQVVGLNGQPVSDRHVSPTNDPGVHRVFLERWPDEDAEPWPYRQLVIRFWPPAAVSGRPAPWSCECGRELSLGKGSGHWDWRINIEPPTARKAFVVR